MRLLRTLNAAFPGLFRMAGFFLLSLVIVTAGVLISIYTSGDGTRAVGAGFVATGLFLGAYGIYVS